MIGQTFGRLTVVAGADTERGGSLRYFCRCACGETCTVRGASLRNGVTRSCGCLRAESSRERTIERNRRRAA